MQSTAVLNDKNTQLSDTDLINLAKTGDESGFEQLIQRYQDRLYRAILSDVGCTFTTEDIVQEAFVKAFLRLDSFQHQSRFYTWLYRIALNLRITHYRKNSRTIHSLETIDQSRLAQRTDPTGAPDDIAVRTEARQQVRRALAELDEQHRRILILRDYDQLDYQTISEILSIQLGTVRSRLHRARAALKNELKRQRNTAAAKPLSASSKRKRKRGAVKGFSSSTSAHRCNRAALAPV